MYRLLGLSPDIDASTAENWDSQIHRQIGKASLPPISLLCGTRSSHELRYRLVLPGGEIRHVIDRAEWMETGSPAH